MSVFLLSVHVLVAFAYFPFIGYCFSASYIATSKWQWILCGRFLFFWRAEQTNRSTLFAAAATTVRHTRSVVHFRWYVQLVRVVLFSRKRTATLANIKFNQIGRDTSCWHSVRWGSKFWAHPPSLLSRSWPRGEKEEDSRKFSRPSYLGSWVTVAAVHLNILFLFSSFCSGLDSQFAVYSVCQTRSLIVQAFFTWLSSHIFFSTPLHDHYTELSEPYLK